MIEGTEVIYTIAITAIETTANQQAAIGILKQYTGSGKMDIVPATEDAPGTISIPRLYTRWRGDASEKTWQSDITNRIDDMGEVAISVAPWSYAPGYPQGDI